MYSFNKLYNCGIFQGAGKTKYYFEGWYFKHVDKNGKDVLAVIPGISYEDSREKAHAFVQIIDGGTYKTNYIRYGMDQFWYAKDSFEIRIGENVFSDKRMELHIEESNICLHGSIEYRNHVAWPSSLKAPSSMGWYAYIPVMECYHGVLSLHHDIAGSLMMNEEKRCFDNGVGYMEKDWGTSFPSSWIWLQSNHFQTPKTSLMLSIAKIPWHGRSFTGFISGLWHEGKIYRFATYTGARIKHLQQGDTEIQVSMDDKKYELIIKAKLGKTGKLQSPVKGAMTGSVQESVDGWASVQLHDKKSRRLLLETQAHCCGMELAGNLQELVSLP